jgi:hypothetical protein
MLRSKKLDIWKKWKLKKPSDENQTGCHENEPNLSKDKAMPEGDNISFWIYKIYFFLDSSIDIRISKWVLQYLATGL